ncbi:hypothetical protein DK846_01440 [Methanospirillum lacunae]|uniref:Uncharacterized protein n=1 Tax=Methanospirillum lacunae TaxID=668570 RepID=A0A2V2N5I4_9EURY|nr:hypothetical protein DK846_01440 [Methanospirillum lacunae]
MKFYYLLDKTSTGRCENGFDRSRHTYQHAYTFISILNGLQHNSKQISARGQFRLKTIYYYVKFLKKVSKYQCFGDMQKFFMISFNIFIIKI